VAGSHQGHKVQTLKQAKSDIKSKMTKLENKLDYVKKDFEDLQENIYKRKKNEIKMVREHFSRISALIFEKETTLLAELFWRFDEKMNYFGRVFESYSSFYTSTKDKVSALNSEMAKGNFENINDEVLNQEIDEKNYVLPYKKAFEFDEKIVQEDLLKELEKVNKIQNFINQETLTYPASWEGFFKSENMGEIILDPDFINSLKKQLKINMSVEIQEGSLILKPKKVGAVLDKVLDKKTLGKINAVHIPIDTRTLSTEDCDFSRFVFENIPQLNTLIVDFSSNLDKQQLLDFFPIIFSKIDQIHDLVLNFEDTCLENQHESIQLLCEYLSKVESLRMFDIKLNSTKISSQSLNLLAACLKKFMRNLTVLHIDLEHLNLTDSDIIQFFCPMPNLKVLNLYLGKNRITDKAIQALASALQKMKTLDEIQVLLSRNNISSQSMLKIISNIQGVVKFGIDMREVQIDDQTVFEFERLTNLMKNLKQAKIIVNKGVTTEADAILQRIHNQFPYSY